MHWIGPALLAVAAVLLALAIRGRVTARGRFCRKCRFDLAGLDPDRPDAACPECGRAVGDPLATRPVLRRRSRWGIAAGVVLLLVGATLTGIAATKNTARIFAAMPDAVVLPLHRLGVEAAFVEITDNRLARIPPLSDRTWSRLIDDAMALHADVNTPWNPRHGEVLATAMSSGRLTPEQARTFLNGAFTPSAGVAQSLRHGSDGLGVTIEIRNAPRSSVMTRMGLLSDTEGDIFHRLEPISARLPALDLTIPLSGGGMTGLSLPSAAGGGGMGSMSSRIDLSGVDWSKVEPDTELAVELTYKVAAVRFSDGHEHAGQTHTANLTTRVLPADADLVALDADPDTIAAFRDGPRIRLAPLHVPPEDQGAGPRARAAIIFDHCPVAISGRVFVIHAGAETHITNVTSHAMPGGYSISSLSWNSGPADPDRTLRDAWLAAGRVTIEIRPDPREAERTPGIASILGVPLRFENVKVTDTDPGASAGSSAVHRDHVAGRPVTDPAITPPPDQPADHAPED
jgi:hypothetical protein